MVTSGTQTASTAGVSMPGVLAIFKNPGRELLFPRDTFSQLLQKPGGLFSVQLGCAKASRGSLVPLS